MSFLKLFSFASPALFASQSRKDAARKEERIATNAADSNMAEVRRQYDQDRADWEPFRQSDLVRRGAADRSYGLGLQPGQSALGDFQSSGDYALLNYQPIMDQTNAAFSAKGMGLDGSAMNAMRDRSTQYALDAFRGWRSGLEGSPTGAQGQVSQAGQNMVAQNNYNRSNAANAMASSFRARSDANADFMNSGLGALGYLWGQRR